MKTVSISELKAKLSQHLRTLKQSGGRLIILDRRRPVAVLTDLETESGLQIEQAACTIEAALERLPELSAGALLTSTNSTDTLLTDRSRR